MPPQDHLQVKEKIISFIKIRGPSLPVHVGKEINTSILFTSAFLSELISEKRLKISSLNVGNSSLYFIPGHETLLEGFSQHLKSKEKEAFELLNQKKILKDSEQHPAIRVALRNIKDFAIPFQKNNEIYWKYLTVSEEELIDKIKEETLLVKEIKKQFEPEQKENKTAEKRPEIKIENEEKHSKIEIARSSPVKTKKRELKKIKEKTSGKKNDKFFNRVKEFLSKKSIEILDIENFSKNDLILRVRINGKEKLLIAYNKKKVNESDIIKAYKKASELKLEYTILNLGEPVKKINDFIKAVRNLEEIRKID